MMKEQLKQNPAKMKTFSLFLLLFYLIQQCALDIYPRAKKKTCLKQTVIIILLLRNLSLAQNYIKKTISCVDSRTPKWIFPKSKANIASSALW